MKKHRSLFILLLLAVLCAGAVGLTLHLTAQYPPPGEPVDYPTNQAEGFVLTLEKPTWSPFKGHTLRWKVTADSDEVYYFGHDGNAPNSFEFLERQLDGQWYRLGYTQTDEPFTTIEFAVGGQESSGLSGSVVQKHAYYGTRLEPGLYRLVLEMKDAAGTPHYLSAPFEVK